MEDDIDIYEDLPNFQVKCNENFVSNSQENITSEQIELNKQIAELTTKLSDCQKVNKNLEINLFSLLKTAKAEIVRKDKMIEELRRKLDNVTFKRGVYAKTNEYVVPKSIFRDTDANVRYKSVDFPSSRSEHNLETSKVDSPPLNLTKDHQSKTTLFPITVFGERLRRRITDEQNLEKKDRQPSKLDIDGSTGRCTDRYVVESDKENGSLCDTNSCNTREIQTSTVAQYSESECIKNPTVTSKIMTKDFLQNGSNEVKMRLERKSTFGTKCSGKRANEETNRPVSVKRIKSTDEQYFLESTKKEADCVAVKSNQEHDFMKSDKSETSNCFSENLRDAFKVSHVERARDSSIEGKTHGYHVCDGIKKHKDKRKVKNEESDVSCGKKDFVNGHFSKRCMRNESAQNSTLALDERNTIHRGIEVFDKRNNHRTTNDERRRAKEREDRRMTTTDDRRSRRRLTSSYGKFREERYDRTKYNNNRRDTCEDRFETGHDFRSSNADKVKPSNLVDKESCGDPRVTIGRMKRSSTDRRGNSVQTSDRHDEYESRRLKSAVKATKRGRRQQEYGEYSRRKLANEKSIERSRYSDVPKYEKSIGKIDCSIDRFGRTEQTETDSVSAKFHGESRDCADEPQYSGLEDGETLDSPVNNPCKNNSRRERSSDRREARNERKLSSLVDVVEKNVEYDESVKGAISAEESQTLPDHVSLCFPMMTNADAASSDETRLGSTKRIENVENVENIEKFIRDYLSHGESAGEVPANSNRQTVTNVSTDSGGVNDDDREREKRSNESELPDTKVDEHFSLTGKEMTNAKLETAVSGNTSLCVSKCFIENNRVETQPMIATFLENVDHVLVNERPQMNSVVELSENSCALDHTADKISILFKIEPPTENNTVKNNFFPKDLCSSISRTVLDSYRETECDGNVDNNCGDGCNDLDVQNPKVEINCQPDICDGDDDHNKDDDDDSYEKYIQNNPDTDMKGRIVNASITTRTSRKNEMISKFRGEDGVRLEGKSSMNVHGKIVVFARRKKPVCLANNNANMTILIRNNREDSISFFGTKNTTVCNSLPKLRICRRPRREENESVGT